MKDLPDYTREMVIRYEGGFIGLEELAARLGSIVPWDMKGNIVLMEDFESEETEWALSESGGTSLASRSSRQKFSGDWSIKLYTANIADAYSVMERLFAAKEATKLAVFTRIAFTEDVREITFGGAYSAGTTLYHFGLTYRPAAQELYYYAATGGDVLLASSLVLATDTLIWWPFLLVVDLVTGYYVKAVVGGVEYDLSAYAMESALHPERSYGSVGVENTAVAAVGGTIYVDDIIIAKNVP